MQPAEKQQVKQNEEGVFVSPHEVVSFDVNAYSSLGECLISHLNRNPNGVVFVDASSGRTWTGSQVVERMLNVASALIDLYDFEPGTSVCIDYDHSDYAVILALGVICAGGVVACAYHKDPYAELLYLAKMVEPRFLFCHQKNAGWARRLEKDLGFSVTAIAMDEQPDSSGGQVDRFEVLWNYDHKKAKSFGLVPVACKDTHREVAMIAMSSGTTGKPKAVPATHAKCIADCFGFTRKADDRVRFACTSSLDYISGRLIVFGAICSGYSAIIIDTFTPKLYAEVVEKYKINIIYIGAAAFYHFITYKDLDKYNISSIKEIFPMGAKIIYLEEMRKFFEKHPHVRAARQGFGSSEMAGGALNTMTPEQYLRDPDNCGQLLPGMQAKIVHPETGKLLGFNEHGILHLKSAQPFPGYYDRSRIREENGSEPSPFVADESILDEDGFYITGDLAYFNEKGDLYVLGRHKELMSCRGAKKVLPHELEDVIEQHPSVSKVCVLGVPNKNEPTLHCPRAFVVLKGECYTGEIKLTERLERDLTAEDVDEKMEHEGEHTLCQLQQDKRHLVTEDLMKFVDERIGWEKRLTGGIVLLDEMPMLRASVGKIDKGFLRALDKSRVEIYGDRSG